MPLTNDELNQRVQRLFIVKLENRSFDHVLGHLSLPGIQPDSFKTIAVDGLRQTSSRSTDYSKIGSQVKNAAYRNLADGTTYFPHHMKDFCATDLPHSRSAVATQVNGGQMDGFVKAYLEESQTAIKRPEVMGFLTTEELPTSTFFATNFGICDRWHASLPTDTQPNRLMGISGYTMSDTTKGLMPDQDTVFDWMDRNKVTWRVYSAGISFYLLMKRLLPRVVFSDSFRSLHELPGDLEKEGNQFPQVVFLEPAYVSNPLAAIAANDNHPPAIMAAGEAFLASVYRTLTASDAFENGLMLVTYDEHGGFFDHVSPPKVPTQMPPGGKWEDPRPFNSLGVRVPIFLISPYSRPGTVFSGLCDHTSVLQFIAERYGNGEYSPLVTARRTSGPEPIGSLGLAIADLLTLSRRALPVAPNVQFVGAATPLAPLPRPRALDESFVAVARALDGDATNRDAAFSKFPHLRQLV